MGRGADGGYSSRKKDVPQLSLQAVSICRVQVWTSVLTTWDSSLLFSTVQLAYHIVQHWQRMLSFVLLQKLTSSFGGRPACFNFCRKKSLFWAIFRLEVFKRLAPVEAFLKSFDEELKAIQGWVVPQHVLHVDRCACSQVQSLLGVWGTGSTKVAASQRSTHEGTGTGTWHELCFDGYSFKNVLRQSKHYQQLIRASALVTAQIKVSLLQKNIYQHLYLIVIRYEDKKHIPFQ